MNETHDSLPETVRIAQLGFARPASEATKETGDADLQYRPPQPPAAEPTQRSRGLEL